MSYASVAAHNAPPPSEQPHADPALLYTHEDADAAVSHVADDAVKVGIVAHDFKEHPATVASEQTIIEQYPTPAPPPPTQQAAPEEAANRLHKAEHKAQTTFSKAEHKAGKVLHSAERKAGEALHKAEDEGFYLWNLVRENILRPGVAGGLLGVVNLGLIGATGYAFYTRPHLRSDTRVIGSTAAAAATILAAQGFGAAQYRNTPQGREEERKAREEGAIVYRQTRQIILRPGVLGGLLGLANIGILGGVGYVAYDNWNRTWDRRTASMIGVGLLTLFSAEGYYAEQVHEGKVHLPKA